MSPQDAAYCIEECPPGVHQQPVSKAHSCADCRHKAGSLPSRHFRSGGARTPSSGPSQRLEILAVSVQVERHVPTNRTRQVGLILAMGYSWQKSAPPDLLSQRSAWRTFSASSIQNARTCLRLHGECLSECGGGASGLRRCMLRFRGLIAMSDRSAPAASFIPTIPPPCEWRRGWISVRSVAGVTKASPSFSCSVGVRRQKLTARSNWLALDTDGTSLRGSTAFAQRLPTHLA
jgi:hypothetical protein